MQTLKDELVVVWGQLRKLYSQHQNAMGVEQEGHLRAAMNSLTQAGNSPAAETEVADAVVKSARWENTPGAVLEGVG